MGIRFHLLISFNESSIRRLRQFFWTYFANTASRIRIFEINTFALCLYFFRHDTARNVYVFMKYEIFFFPKKMSDQNRKQIKFQIQKKEESTMIILKRINHFA